MRDLATVLSEVVGVLDRNRIPYMVVGGFANLIWGEPRTTRDIEITVDIHAFTIDRFIDLVNELGEALTKEPAAFAERTRVLPIKTHDGIPVDFILATQPFELAAIRRAQAVEIESTRVKTCTPQDLIVQKIVSERPRDHEDVIGILKAQHERVDLVALEEVVKELALGMEEPAIWERFEKARLAAGFARPER